MKKPLCNRNRSHSQTADLVAKDRVESPLGMKRAETTQVLQIILAFEAFSVYKITAGFNS